MSSSAAIEDGPLRASEFAATLNGDNPDAILRVLKQFVKTVRKERQWALSNWIKESKSHHAKSAESDSEDSDNMSVDSDSDNNDDDNTPDDDDHSKEPPTKKYKKSEQWKVDTASYNVPFIGTAVARGEVAKVEKGEWPTGLVKAYLEKSPLAVELLNQDLRAPNGQLHKSLLKKNRRKLSASICKAHCLALAELLTVAIPKTKLEEYSLDDDNKPNDHSTTNEQQTRFIPDFIKGALPWIFELLNHETEKGRGKTGVKGGCGPSVAPALRILQNFSLTSTSNARLVARHLDESLSGGVLRLCLRPLHVKKESPDEVAEEPPQKPARAEAIRLGTCLLKTEDAATNAYICTSGNRERKIKPGIVYIAFREGIAATPGMQSIDHIHYGSNDDYHDAVGDMFEVTRRLLFQGTTTAGNSRLLFELISREPLQHLTQIASHVPALTAEMGFQAVLDSSDTYEGASDAFERMGIEARRLLFLLLSDPSKSPLLLRREGNQIARSMTRLLETATYNIELHQFVIHCMKTSPFLVKEVFSLLNIPDPQKGFDYIGRVGLIVSILRKGPSALDCLLSSRDPSGGAAVEEILPILFPSKFRSQFLAKSLQSGTPIVLMESLKFVISLFDRYHELVGSEGISHLNWDEGFVTQLSSSLKKLLPDIRTMISLWGRLDGTKVAGAVLMDYLFQVIEAYVSTYPDHSNQVALDLLKLLPETHVAFTGLLPRVQMQSLKCIQTIIQSSQSHNEQLLLSSKSLCGIMLSTKNRRVHDICHDITVRLLGPALLPRGSDDETERYIKHEAATWIDALTPSTLSIFFDLLEGSLGQKSWPHLVSIGTAWKRCQAPRRMNFSVIIAAALSKSDESSIFASFVGQAIARCIFYMSDPLPLAAVVVCTGGSENSIASNDVLAPLRNYAGMLMDCSTGNKAARVESLSRLVGSYFSEKSMYAKALRGLSGGDGSTAANLDLCSISSRSTVVELVKFLNQALIITSNDDNNTIKSYMSIIGKLLPGLLLSSSSSEMKQMAMPVIADVFSIRDKFEDQSSIPGSIDSLASLAAYSSSGIGEGVGELDRVLHNRDGRMRLLYSYAMGQHMSSSSRLRTVISLISHGIEESSDLALEIASSFHDISSVEHQFDRDLWSVLVKCWILVSNQVKEHDSISLRRFKDFLTTLMNESADKNDFNVSMLLSLLSDHPDNSVVELCLDTAADNPATIPPEVTLLSTLLQRDCLRYWQSVTKRLTDMDRKVSRLWDLGCLDSIATECLSQSKEMCGSQDPFLQDFVPMVMNRVVTVLSEIDTTTMSDSALLFDLASKALVKCSDFHVPLDDVVEAIDRVVVLFDICHEPSRVVSPTMEKLCKLAVYIALETEHEPTPLGSHLLSFLLSHLPMIVKRSKSRVHGALGLSARAAIKWLLDLLDKSACSDSKELKRVLRPEVVAKATKSCLKHGIATSSSEVSSSLSLRLIEKLLTWASKSDCPIASFVPSPCDIFEMVTSHSKFQLLFTEELDANDIADRKETQIAVLRLMQECVALTPQKILIPPSTWTTILTPFNAGSGELDTLIRQLANTCSESPFLDEFRFFGSIDSENVNPSSNRWDWFLQEVSPSRIRATIANFPMNEQFNLSRNSADDGPMPGASHKRYSPVFFLALLLGALEGCLTLTEKTDVVDDSDNDEPAFLDISAASAETVHRLCDKGVVGICFMALCSKCERVRLHAAATLGIIAQVASTEKAKEVSSWRDRPQLLMILNSVRRGLASLRESDENSPVVPRILPIVANFLARAAFVVARPDDPLYEAINRYFLKSESGHGAFQDFHRLPAFMSLFCSRANDPMRSRAERRWALQNIRDGLMDAASFRVVSSCHAPELILTSFENVRLSNVSKESQGTEYCLLLEALKAMLDHGGYAAHTHLIRRCGLLAWMNSICGRELATFFPTTKAAVAFCDFAKSTMGVLLQNDPLRTALTTHEVCGLIEPLLLLCLVNNDKAVIPSAFAALRDICSALTLLEEEQEPKIHPNTLQSGASLHSTLQVLHLTEGMMRESALEILCDLPVSFASGLSRDDVDDFVLLSLKCCERHNVARFMTLLLRRISFLFEHTHKVSSRKMDSRAYILKRIFSLRSHLKFTKTNDLEDLWKNCLQLAQDFYRQDEDEMTGFKHS